MTTFEMPVLLVLSGQIGTGKTALATALNKAFGAETVRARDLILRRTPSIKRERSAFQVAGDLLDDTTDHYWLREEMDHVFSGTCFPKRRVVLDAVRTHRQLFWLRNSEEYRVVHVHLTASHEALQRRFHERRDVLDINSDYASVKKNRHENEVASLINDADLSFDTEESGPSEIADIVGRAAWPDLEPFTAIEIR